MVDELLVSKKKISFDEDGNFKALILADVHASGTLPANVQANIKTLIDRENPQLVIFTGDNAICSNETTLRQAIDSMVGYIEEKEIPWCHVYGNHDHEGGMSKESMQKIFESYEYCVSKRGDTTISGVGNYVLPVYKYDSDEVGFLVWCLDSGNYISEGAKGALGVSANPYDPYSGSSYDYIKPNQISWYYSTSVLFEQYFGTKMNSIMAFHIPLQENHYAWENRDKATSWAGSLQETICASAINSGLFVNLVTRGDVRAVVTGHDHKNDYMIETGGIKLCSSPNVSTTTYHDTAQQGARVFQVTEKNPRTVKTYVNYLIERENVDPDDYEEIATGTTISSFESETEVNSYFYETSNTDNTHVAEIAEGKGVDGTDALMVGRTTFAGAYNVDNTAVIWKLDTPGMLGDNKYLIVWLDFTGQNAEAVNFRKACFGLMVAGSNSPYRTDDKDEPTPFYYLADGSTTWQEMSHGSDGCFGADQGSSISGKKGYFAFPIDNMLQGSIALTGTSIISGVYMYYTYAYGTQNCSKFYIDDVRLVEDYTTFTK